MSGRSAAASYPNRQGSRRTGIVRRPPFGPASPAPLILSLIPSSAPFGTETFRVEVVCTEPAPPQSAQGLVIRLPCPLHVGQAVMVTKEV